MDQETIEQLVRRYRRDMARAWEQVQANARNAYTLEELETLFATGNEAEAVAVFNAVMQPLANAWQRSFVGAADETARALSAELGAAGSGEIALAFDVVNEGAVDVMRNNQLRLVREFSDTQRRTTQQALVRGITEGANPRDQARAFRNSIGLTQRQEAAVANFRRLLENNDAEALSRQLRDRRFDRTVTRAIQNKEPLSRDQIDRMVGRYRERYIKYRSEVIARTESMRAVHEGQERMIRQAVEQGVIAADQLVREWNTALDGRVRSFESTQGKTSHQTMHGQLRVGVEESFISGAGNALRYPTDPAAPGYDTIQCRCTVSVRVDLSAGAVESISGVRAIE